MLAGRGPVSIGMKASCVIVTVLKQSSSLMLLTEGKYLTRPGSEVILCYSTVQRQRVKCYCTLGLCNRTTTVKLRSKMIISRQYQKQPSSVEENLIGLEKRGI